MEAQHGDHHRFGEGGQRLRFFQRAASRGDESTEAAFSIRFRFLISRAGLNAASAHFTEFEMVTVLGFHLVRRVRQRVVPIHSRYKYQRGNGRCAAK